MPTINNDLGSENNNSKEVFQIFRILIKIYYNKIRFLKDFLGTKMVLLNYVDIAQVRVMLNYPEQLFYIVIQFIIKQLAVYNISWGM